MFPNYSQPPRTAEKGMHMKTYFRKSLAVVLSVLMLLSVSAYSAFAVNGVKIATSAAGAAEGEYYVDLDSVSGISNSIYWEFWDRSGYDDWNSGDPTTWVSPWGDYSDTILNSGGTAYAYEAAADLLTGDCMRFAAAVTEVLKQSDWYLDEATYTVSVDLSGKHVSLTGYGVGVAPYDVDVDALINGPSQHSYDGRPVSSNFLQFIKANIPDDAWQPVAPAFSEDLEAGAWYLDADAANTLMSEKWDAVKEGYRETMIEYYSEFLSREEAEQMADEYITHMDGYYANAIGAMFTRAETICFYPANSLFTVKEVIKTSHYDPATGSEVEGTAEVFHPFADIMQSGGDNSMVLSAAEYLQIFKQVEADQPDDPNPDDPNPDDPNPDDPTPDDPTPTDPAGEDPAASEGTVCEYCGKVHGDGFLGWIVLLFHRVLAFFRSVIALFK